MNEEQQINEYEAMLNQLDVLLEPLQQCQSLNQMSEQLDDIEVAKLNCSLAFTINSLYYNYLRLNNYDTKNHKIFEEINRNKQYFKKIQQLQEDKKPEQQNPIKVNISAANRMIQQNLQANEDVWTNENQQTIPKDKKKF